MPPPTLDHGVRARERVVCQHGLEGAQQQLSVVFALKQHAEGLGEALNPLDVKRLKALEAENARLERVVADKELEIDALRETGRAKW